MSSRQVLAGLARRLNREAGGPDIPALFFLTDPERTPDPAAAIRRLPAGAAVIYRHFGAPGRRQTARALARLCQKQGLRLLIAADPELARDVGADGVHWPEARLPVERDPFALVTASAHSAPAVARAAALGADACLLSPIFPTRSASARAPLGVLRASRIAQTAGIPIIALGGVNDRNAARLAGHGFAGLAAIDALI